MCVCSPAAACLTEHDWRICSYSLCHHRVRESPHGMHSPANPSLLGIPSTLLAQLQTLSALCAAHVTLLLQVIVRPLVVGERVSLSGTVNVTGVVEQLDFLQTVIRTDTHIPYTLPNKVCMGICTVPPQDLFIGPLRMYDNATPSSVPPMCLRNTGFCWAILLHGCLLWSLA